MRIDFLQAKGRAALATAADAADPASYLRSVESAARQLNKQRTPWALAHASLLHSALAAAKRDRDAATRFKETAAAFEACDGHLFAAAARMRAAQLDAIGYNEAVLNMSRLGVQNPKSMAFALIPG